MQTTQGTLASIQEQWKTQDVKILDPSSKIKNFPTDPRMLFFKTNNFVQQGLNRLLGFSSADGSWTPVSVNADGELIVGKSVLYRDRFDVVLTNGINIPIGNALVTDGLDVAGFPLLTVFVKSTGAGTVTPQFSLNQTDWYTSYNEAGTAVSWTAATENRSFIISNRGPYFRMILDNTDAAGISVSLGVFGSA